MTTAFGPSSSGLYAGEIDALAVQPDLKIIAAGYSFENGRYSLTVARYTTEGTLDPGFGTAGIMRLAFDDVNTFASAVALQADGRILVSGSTATTSSGFLLVRLNADGTPDRDFGHVGIVTDGGPVVRTWTIALQPDGRIITGGTTSDNHHFALARHNTNGTPDPTFGSGGATVTESSGDLFAILSIAIQSDGKIVAAGSWGLARYDPDGTLDTTFGACGVVAPPDCFGPSALALDAESRIVVGGTFEACGSSDYDETGVVRYIGGDLSLDGAPRLPCASSTTTTSLLAVPSTSTTSTSSSTSTSASSTAPSVVTTSSTSTRVTPSPTTTTLRCLEDAPRDCDDGNPCTDDRCERATCVSVQKPGLPGLRCRLDEAGQLLRDAPANAVGSRERHRLLMRMRAVRRLAGQARPCGTGACLREAAAALRDLDRAINRDATTGRVSSAVAAETRAAVQGAIAALRELTP